MKPSSSPLKILDFAITKFDFKFIHDRGKDYKPMAEYFQDYELDIDFNVYKGELLQVDINVDVNKKGQIPGYSIAAVATCFFELDKAKNVNDEQRVAMEGFSIIYISLNSIRGLISNFTANAPVGRYILPSIDLNDLISQKKEAIANDDKKKKKTE